MRPGPERCGHRLAGLGRWHAGSSHRWPRDAPGSTPADRFLRGRSENVTSITTARPPCPSSAKPPQRRTTSRRQAMRAARTAATPAGVPRWSRKPPYGATNARGPELEAAATGAERTGVDAVVPDRVEEPGHRGLRGRVVPGDRQGAPVGRAGRASQRGERRRVCSTDDDPMPGCRPRSIVPPCSFTTRSPAAQAPSGSGTSRGRSDLQDPDTAMASQLAWSRSLVAPRSHLLAPCPGFEPVNPGKNAKDKPCRSTAAASRSPTVQAKRPVGRTSKSGP